MMNDVSFNEVKAEGRKITIHHHSSNYTVWLPNILAIDLRSHAPLLQCQHQMQNVIINVSHTIISKSILNIHNPKLSYEAIRIWCSNHKFDSIIIILVPLRSDDCHPTWYNQMEINYTRWIVRSLGYKSPSFESLCFTTYYSLNCSQLLL